MKTPPASLLAGWSLLAGASLSSAVTASQTPAVPAVTAPATPASAAGASPATTLPDLTRTEATRLIGVNFGQQLLRLGITDPAALDSLSKGMKEGLAGRKTTADEQQRLAHFFYASTKAAISGNLNNAHGFLLHNAGQKDVHTTSSGLQYIILAAGDPAGVSPTLGDQVTVRYRGTLLDGSEFDSSEVRGAASTFLVGGVIKGWQEALVMMKPGAKWRLFVPPELAYGTKARPNIPGGSLLIFDVELTGVTPAASVSASPAAPSSASPPVAPATTSP